ncbi:patatin-like phospholipase family protein [Conexibacter sp. SYSU D00693]|uniref:patatin-like phospholipase family protein n=1 Tax=Conexibacter sp. SYSU D00693 TaxID=2812560 RepID=UPI00196A418E|nr:patatin-like phospholipase family protein [Conexibacter sp. SYSU D00693]
MRIGLVLGAGGVVGASWLVGALEALADETGWDPASAEHVVGTSAGSVVGAIVADGLAPALMGAHLQGPAGDDVQDADDRADELAERVGGHELRLARALPPIGPGSARLALSSLVHLRRRPPAMLMAGLLPRGFVSTDPIKDLVRDKVRGAWPEHPSFWAVAADYGTGRRVAFGREDAPVADVTDAVAASCAIPGFYHPVRVAGRSYVDGGICSMSNLDLLCGRGLDLVVCLNPTSSLAEAAGGTPGERMGALMRAASGKRLGHEARKLRARGTEVLLVQPSAEDVALMGVNLMAHGRRVEVLEQARRSTALAVRELRREGALLPGSSRRRRLRAVPAPQRRAA